jgi:Ca2+/Na+ antiporter
MFFEIIQFFVYSALIILISKYILVKTLRKLAENLNLKPQTVGDIAGYATSVPELLTIGASSFRGLMGASIYNILSSNIINLIQYLASVFMSKNKKAFQNKAILTDIGLVIITIIIPILFMWANIELNLSIVPIFILLYFLFRIINQNVHKVYLKKEDEKLAKQIEEEEQKEKGNTKNTLLYTITLLGTGILLFVIGDALGNTLENLANTFGISQTFLGILLGFATSLPELITFFEAQKHYQEQEADDILGVVEATNNLLTSNILNLFAIQSIGILIFHIFH